MRKKNAPICTPCQHFSGRSIIDEKYRLWSSWVAIGSTKKLYFAGDTGYRSVPRGFKGDESSLKGCPVFREIGDKIILVKASFLCALSETHSVGLDSRDSF